MDHVGPARLLVASGVFRPLLLLLSGLLLHVMHFPVNLPALFVGVTVFAADVLAHLATKVFVRWEKGRVDSEDWKSF